MQRQRSLVALILVLIILAIVVLVKIPLQQGLDLRGGAQLTIQVKTTEEIPEIAPDQLEAVKTVVDRRVNALGVSESQVQTIGSDQILVQLPGVNDPQQAERVLGGTAQLDFRKQIPGTEAQLQIEQQLRQQLLFEQAALLESEEGGDPEEEAIAENQAALERSKPLYWRVKRVVIQRKRRSQKIKRL